MDSLSSNWPSATDIRVVLSIRVHSGGDLAESCSDPQFCYMTLGVTSVAAVRILFSRDATRDVR